MGRICLILLTLSLFGCAFSPVKRPETTHNVFDFKGEFKGNAFELTEFTLKYMGWDIHLSDPERGVIKTKTLPATVEDVGFCGTWNGMPVKGTCSVGIEAKVTEQEVQLWALIFTEFTAQNLYGQTTRKEAYQCRSNGRMEKKVLAFMNKFQDRKP